MPSMEDQGYIFHNGQWYTRGGVSLGGDGPHQIGNVTTGLATLTTPTSLLRSEDELLMLSNINFGGFHDGSIWADCTTKLQEVLWYAHNLAKTYDDTVFDNLDLRKCVTVTVPMGKFPFKDQLIVPEWVNLHVEGLLIRTYAGDLVDINRPAILFVHKSHNTKMNLRCNYDGTHEGNGVVYGKSWGWTSAAVAAGGTGYVVNDTITVTNESAYPYVGTTLKVTSIGAAGVVTGVAIALDAKGNPEIGAWSKPPSMQPATFAQASTSGTGTGAVFTPTWAADFPSSGFGSYNTGLQNLTCATIIGDVEVKGVGTANDDIHDGQFAVRIASKNAKVNTIETEGGFYGIEFNKCLDIHINHMNPVLAAIGARVYSGGAITCPNVVIDSCFNKFIQLDDADGIYWNGRAFWADENDAYYSPPGQGGAAIKIGSNTTFGNTDIHLDFMLTNSGTWYQSNPALWMDKIFHSDIKLTVGNISPFNATLNKFTNYFAYFGANVDNSVSVSGAIDGVTGTLLAPGSTVPAFSYRVWDKAGAGYARANGVYELSGSGAPVSGVSGTGLNKAGPGSVYTDYTNGVSYINSGASSSPVWKSFLTTSALIPTYTWAGLPSAATAGIGTIARVSDVGVGASGSLWISDGTQWRPSGGRVLVARKNGSLAAPLATLTGITAAQWTLSGGFPVIPAGMLVGVTGKVAVKLHFRRRGTTATANLNIRLGTAGTTADSTLYGNGYAATNNLDGLVDAAASLTSATAFTTTNWAKVNDTSGGTSAAADRTTNVNAAAAMTVSFDISVANAADSFDLISYSVWVEE